ncbi:zf-C3HC-domain-containing protein [Tothia fuscella]|uniref:Zf-C3HC-domain-containing protein n=1 Tax=Tothia fuscella TaxID=1048955 RepID=A0A9P4U158_9PEZI|nr:zf-C3HC-domain-containing protein [Tothia fuscella]
MAPSSGIPPNPPPTTSTSNTLNINSSKRKFYKLLDNLSTSKANLASNTEKNASSTTLAEPQTKRLFKGLGLSSHHQRPVTAPAPARGARHVSVGRPNSSSVRAVGGPSGSLDKRRPKSYATSPRVGSGVDGGKLLNDTRKTPNYSPWDHERFLGRLKTFADVKTWGIKPPQLSEVEWAKRGWVVVGKDMVCCKGGCEKSLTIQLEKSEGHVDGDDGNEGEEEPLWWLDDAEKEIVKRYEELIVYGHADDCLWRRSGCKDDIYGIKMADSMVWQRDLKERYLSLLTVKSEMPNRWGVADDHTLEHFIHFDIDVIVDSLPVELLQQMAPSPIENAPESSNPAESTEQDTAMTESHTIDKTVLALAMCGWTGQDITGVKLVSCPKCFQRIGLWLYNQDQITRNSEERKKDGIVPTDSDVDTTPMFFDPVELHREHCPWKNVESQCSSGSLKSMPAWQIQYKLVIGAGLTKKRRSGGADSFVSSRKGSMDEDGSEGRKSRAEIVEEDKNRRSRIQKIKRAFTVKRKSKA